MAMEISDETYVIDLGEIKAHGPSKEMIESEEIKKAYLGD